MFFFIIDFMFYYFVIILKYNNLISDTFKFVPFTTKSRKWLQTFNTTIVHTQWLQFCKSLNWILIGLIYDGALTLIVLSNAVWWNVNVIGSYHLIN